MPGGATFNRHGSEMLLGKVCPIPKILAVARLAFPQLEGIYFLQGVKIESAILQSQFAELASHIFTDDSALRNPFCLTCCLSPVYTDIRGPLNQLNIVKFSCAVFTLRLSVKIFDLLLSVVKV